MNGYIKYFDNGGKNMSFVTDDEKVYDKYNEIWEVIRKLLDEHIKDRIDNLKSTKDIYSICSYLMNICCEEYFKLSQDEYLKIKEFINNNIDIIESALAPMNDYFDLYKNSMVIIIARVIIIIRKKIYFSSQ